MNEFQKDAVLSCVTAKECHHNDTTKLIWGPRGLAMASLLFSLLKLQARTLTCAPPNNAVLEVAARLQNLRSHLSMIHIALVTLWHLAIHLE